MTKKPQIGICTFEELTAEPRVQVLPDGVFKAEDGRPHGLAGWKLNAKIAAAVIKRAHARKRDTVIDYEHQIMSGAKAIAAGWYHDLEYEQGKGMFIADARWTDTARGHIENKEYRYVSAVFAYDPDTGEILRLHNVTITNDPGIDGMQELEVKAAARFDINPTEDSEMKEILIALLTLLGLEETATEEEAVTALKSVLEKAGGVDDLNNTIVALKSQIDDKGERFDPKKHVDLDSFEELKTKFNDLSEKVRDEEIEALVSQGIKDGKLLAKQEDWATKLGKSDLAALKSYLNEATPSLQMGSNKQSENALDDDGNPVLTDQQKAICKNTGVSEEDFIAQLKKQNAKS